MAVAELTTDPSGPLTLGDQQEIAAAHTRAKKVRKAAAVAAFNGWVTAAFAVLSAPFSIFSLSGIFVTAGLAIVAYNEFQGRRRLLKLTHKPLGSWGGIRLASSV